MKAIAILFAASLISTPLLAEDLCSLNLHKLADQLAIDAPLGDPLEQQIEGYRQEATKAQAQGDIEMCIAKSAQALQLLQSSNHGSSGHN